MILEYLSGNKLKLSNNVAGMLSVLKPHLASTLRILCVIGLVFFIKAVAMPADTMPEILRYNYQVYPGSESQLSLAPELKFKASHRLRTAYQMPLAFSAAVLLAVGKPFLDCLIQIKSNAINQVEFSGKKTLSVNSSFWRVRSCDENKGTGPLGRCFKMPDAADRINSQHC